MASVLWCVRSVRVFLLYLTLFFKTTFTATQNHPLLFLSIIQTKPVEMRRIGKSFRWYIIWFGGHYQASKKFVFSRFAQCTVGDFLSLMNLSSKACGLVVSGSTSFHINVFFCICWRTCLFFFSYKKQPAWSLDITCNTNNIVSQISCFHPSFSQNRNAAKTGHVEEK